MPRLSRLLAAAVAVMTLSVTTPRAAEQTVRLYAAGSLKTALSDVASAFEARYGTPVATTFGPSGLLRQRIESGETAHVFASANMKHPRTLVAAGQTGPVVLFARNRLCALAQADVAASAKTLLDTLLRDDLRLGTSTPKADPSGDYAWALFAKAEALRPGAEATLSAKAEQLTGGPDSETPPAGRNPYAWVMEQMRPDLFLTYCTNAVLAQREIPSLRIVEPPAALAVGANYGLLVFDGAPAAAHRLALFMLAPEGQSILAGYGFASGALPAKD